jgi:hypothetical protein
LSFGATCAVAGDAGVARQLRQPDLANRSNRSNRSKRFCIWDRRMQMILIESVGIQNIFDLLCVSNLKDFDQGCRSPNIQSKLVAFKTGTH